MLPFSNPILSSVSFGFFQKSPSYPFRNSRLYNEVERACLFRGLDPYLGLYHTERYGKPALVLDLVEEFRVPIVDSVVFPLFLEKDFSTTKNFDRKTPIEYQLSTDGKKSWKLFSSASTK